MQAPPRASGGSIPRLGVLDLDSGAGRRGAGRQVVEDPDQAVWMPRERMKAYREHRVPLSYRAVEVLSEAKQLQTTEFRQVALAAALSLRSGQGEGVPERAIFVDFAVAGEGMQHGSGYGLVDGELRLLHAHRAKNVFVVEFAHGFVRGALDDLSEDNVVSVRILLT